MCVKPPGALLQTLQDGFALSLALISSDSSSFALFEEPPAVLTSPIVSVQLYTSGSVCSAGRDQSDAGSVEVG